MKLSACIITKNEQDMIERCLKSLNGVDEIIVVDTGSTDDTIKIAERYATVYTDYKWNDDFAEARNYALSKATGDWIISIDADEMNLTPIEIIRTDISGAGNHNALNVKMMWDENHSHSVPRIFKKGLTYTGKCHEYITANPMQSDIVFKYDKSPTHEQDPDRNLRILLSDSDNPRSMFYLANEYYDRNDLEKALEWYDKYLKVGTWRYELADANLKSARCLWRLYRGEEARERCMRAILLNPQFKEAFLLMSEMVWENESPRWKEMAETADNTNVIFVRQ